MTKLKKKKSLQKSNFDKKKALEQLNKIAGSVELPKRFQGKSISFIIEESKKEYFAEHYKK
jgi:hypothetical protein